MRWDTAREVVRVILNGMFHFKNFRLLSVNIPSLPIEDIKGFRWTSLGSRIYEKPVRLDGDMTFKIEGKPVFKIPPGSDIHAVKNGYVSITPLGFDLTDRNHLTALSAIKFNLEFATEKPTT